MYLYGRNNVKEALKKNNNFEKIYFQEHFQDQNLISIARNLKIPIRFVPKSKLEELAKGNHQGVVLVQADFKYDDFEDLKKESSFLVILDHIEDPHNFGAIIRTCEAAHVDGMIIPKDRSVTVTPTVSKVSAGAINHMKISKVTNLVDTVEELKKQGFWIVGTTMNGSDYDKIDYRVKIAIIIGNEGKGMSPLLQKHCDFLVTIPMKGTINSLNASVASGIIVFEAVKQRR